MRTHEVMLSTESKAPYDVTLYGRIWCNISKASTV